MIGKFLSILTPVPLISSSRQNIPGLMLAMHDPDRWTELLGVRLELLAWSVMDDGWDSPDGGEGAAFDGVLMNRIDPRDLAMFAGLVSWLNAFSG